MKITIIILLLSISLYSFGQDKNSQKLLPDNYFQEQLEKKKLPYSFDISPEFQKEYPSLKFDFSYPLPEIRKNEKETEIRLKLEKLVSYCSKMPVMKGDFHSNMPVSVPDSSVHYFILNKKIEVINPLERKFE